MKDPTIPTDNTVSFQFGALASAGDTYAIGLASPLNLSDPDLALTMSTAIRSASRVRRRLRSSARSPSTAR